MTTLPTPASSNNHSPSASVHDISTINNNDSIIPHPRQFTFSTLCVTVDAPSSHPSDPYNASSVPIYQSATFKGSPEDGNLYDYSRSGNPTRSYLETHLSKLSGAKYAMAVSSGMAALDVIMRLLKSGEEVVAGDDLYGGTNRLLRYLEEHQGVGVRHVDTTKDPREVFGKEGVLSEKTRIVLLESPTNPLLKIANIPGIVEVVKSKCPEALIVVDNTMMSPFLQRPLLLGADIVYDSATKYLSGHHDLMAGVIVCDRGDVASKIAYMINASGNGLSPFDSFLLLRGTKTLALRMSRQGASAMLVAQYLHALGFPTFYPGLITHPGHKTHFTSNKAQGSGAVLSFRTYSRTLSEKIVRCIRLWGISVSFGAVNSLISLPCSMSHASIPSHIRAERGLPEDLIRLCVGIEDPGDLMGCLEEALVRAGAITVVPGGGGGYVRVPVEGEEEMRKIDIERGLLLQGVERLTLEDDEEELTTPPSEVAGENQHVGSKNIPIIVSAPGKVILFGEHAVVHGVTAIAASVDLRCYALLRSLHPSTSNKIIKLTFKELNYTNTWNVSSLPWNLLPSSPSEVELEEALVEALSKLLESVERLERSASLVFLYLYMILFHETRPSLELLTRSTIPLGAGMGSSAAYSTCLSGAFLHHISSTTSSPPPTKESINTHAFLGEKILHGNPSGVDNTVSVFGGGISFKRGEGGYVRNLTGFGSIPLIVTDTRVGRDTKALVKGVGEMKAKEPEYVQSILDSIQSISDRATVALTSASRTRPEMLTELSECISLNHTLLQKLNVSHPSLEKIRDITKKDEWGGLSTKLTGAGGGGCAVTLLGDGYPLEKLDKLEETLRKEGFRPYRTSVGGPGFGVLSLSSSSEEDGSRWDKVEDVFEDLKSDLGVLGGGTERMGRWTF